MTGTRVRAPWVSPLVDPRTAAYCPVWPRAYALRDQDQDPPRVLVPPGRESRPVCNGMSRFAITESPGQSARAANSTNALTGNETPIGDTPNASSRENAKSRNVRGHGMSPSQLTSVFVRTEHAS